MFSIILCVTLLGQVDAPPQNPSYAEQLKTYLLTRLTVDLHFDENKLSEVRRKLNNMDEQQLEVLAQVYYERAKARQEWEQARLKAQQAIVLNEAQLNLERARAYRNHLAREYQRRLVQQQMEANLVQQSIVSQQQMMGYGGYGFRPFVFQPFGGYNGWTGWNGWIDRRPRPPSFYSY